MARMVVVAYDVANDRRRTRLYKLLLRFGTPVQLSVFECLLDDAQYAALQAAVRKVVRPRLDHVRYYHLCATCMERIETTAAGEAPAKDAASYVV